MFVLYIETDNRKKELTLYQLPRKQMIGKVNSLKVKDLCKFLMARRFPVKIIVLDMYKPYIELLYQLYPESLICITPSSIRNLFEKSIELGISDIHFEEEVAVTLEPHVEESFDMHLLSQFVDAFYTCSDAEEAVALYNLWQAYIPLNQPKFYKLIRTIEFYKKEILNYFELKKILAASR